MSDKPFDLVAHRWRVFCELWADISWHAWWRWWDAWTSTWASIGYACTFRCLNQNHPDPTP